MSTHLVEERARLKAELKRWQTEFITFFGRNPTSSDVPAEQRAKQARYNELKGLITEGERATSSTIASSNGSSSSSSRSSSMAATSAATIASSGISSSAAATSAATIASSGGSSSSATATSAATIASSAMRTGIDATAPTPGPVTAAEANRRRSKLAAFRPNVITRKPLADAVKNEAAPLPSC